MAITTAMQEDPPTVGQTRKQGDRWRSQSRIVESLAGRVAPKAMREGGLRRLGPSTKGDIRKKGSLDVD